MNRFGFLARAAQAIAAAPAIASFGAVGSRLGTVAAPAIAPMTGWIGEFQVIDGELLVDDDVAVIHGGLDAAGAQNLAECGFTRYVEIFKGGATSIIRDLAHAR